MSNTLPIENYVPFTHETTIIRPGRLFFEKLKLSENEPKTYANKRILLEEKKWRRAGLNQYSLDRRFYAFPAEIRGRYEVFS